MDLIKIAEEAFATGKQHPSFKAGDKVAILPVAGSLDPTLFTTLILNVPVSTSVESVLSY